jgi:hypothetical protein
MYPIKEYQYLPTSNQPVGFSRGFSLAVVIILCFVAVIIGGLVLSIQNSTYAANARLVYLAAQAKAIEFAASGNYQVPVQADLLDLIGAEVNQDAVISIFDENHDATIDYIVYARGGLVTNYAPGELATSKEK